MSAGDQVYLERKEKTTICHTRNGEGSIQTTACTDYTEEQSSLQAMDQVSERERAWDGDIGRSISINTSIKVA